MKILFFFFALVTAVYATGTGASGNIVGQSHYSLQASGAVTKVGYNTTTGKVRIQVGSYGTITDTSNNLQSQATTRISVASGAIQIGSYQGTTVIEASGGSSLTCSLECNFVSWQNVGVMTSNPQTTFTFTVTVPRTGSIQVPKSNFDLVYSFQDAVTGKLIMSLTVPAGTSPNLSVVSPDGNSVTWQAVLKDASLNLSGQVVPTPGTDTIAKTGTIVSGDMSPGTGSSTPGVDTSYGVGPVLLNPAGGSMLDAVYYDKSTTMSQASGQRFVVDPATLVGGSTAATNAGIIQGANLVANAVGVTGGEAVSAIQAVTAAVKASSGGGGSGGGTTVDMSATNGKLDSLNTSVGASNTRLDAVNTGIGQLGGKIDNVATRIDAAETQRHTDAQAAKDAIVARDAAKAEADTQLKSDAASAWATASAQSSAAKVAGEAVVNGLGGVSGTPPTIDTGNASVFAVSFGGYSFDFDPAHQAEIATASAWFKSFIKWGLLVVYAWWCWGQLEKLGLTMTQMEQAKGNTVVGSGGQFTGMIAAGVITVIIWTAVPTIWAAASTPGISTSAFWDDASSIAPTGAAISGALYLVYFFIPVGFILTLISQAFLFRKFALATCIGVFSAIKWVVP